jgi:hypothetical protein
MVVKYVQVEVYWGIYTGIDSGAAQQIFTKRRLKMVGFEGVLRTAT